MFGRSVLKQARFFSAIAKKPKMELTVRTPYRTIVENFEGWSRLTCKTNEAVLSIQNRAPPATYILPPGYLRVIIFDLQQETPKNSNLKSIAHWWTPKI
jgi:hypothetical protein